MKENDSFVNCVYKDLKEVKKYYKYTEIINYPIKDMSKICIKTIALNNRLFEETYSRYEDCVKDYSREIYVVIDPRYYKTNGCDVYGIPWDVDRIPQESLHLYLDNTMNGCRKLCVGVPASFKNLSNPILECIRSAEHLITAYILYLKGVTNKIELIEYSHGEKGKKEYYENKNKYKTK